MFYVTLWIVGNSAFSRVRLAVLSLSKKFSYL